VYPHLNIEMAKTYQHELEARAAHARHYDALDGAPTGRRVSIARPRAVRVALSAVFAKPLRLAYRPTARS